MSSRSYSLTFAATRFLVASNRSVSYFMPNRFTAFLDKQSDPFCILNFHSVEKSTIQSKSFAKSAYDNTFSGFEYPLRRFEVPAWNSKIFNSTLVRTHLANCAKHSNSVSLEIRKDSVTAVDFQEHRIDIFFLKRDPITSHKSRMDPILFSPFLHDINALMIHCSCVSFDGQAAIFMAMDEGGKTTAATLCTSGNVLSDDQIVFRKKDNDEWLAYGTPWTTFPPHTGSASPKAFFLLEKSDKFSLTKLSSKELLAHLWNEHYKSRLMIPKKFHIQILDLYRSLASSAPVYLMKFPKDYIDQEAILKCLDH